MPDPISTSAIAIGSLFAEWATAKGFETGWKHFKKGQILDRAINKTSQRFTPSQGSVAGSTVRTCLEQWADDPDFKRLLRNLSDGEQIDKDYIAGHFVENGGYPESTTRHSASEIVEFFLQHLRDELYNSEGGPALMMRRIEQMHAADQSNEASDQERQDQIISSLASVSKPAREAVNAYLEESQTWDSPQKLIGQDHVRQAVEILEQEIQKIQELQEEYPEVVPLFRKHRQYLLLKTASLYSQIDSVREARKSYAQAEGEPFSSPKHRQLALTVLLNLQRVDEYREVLEGGEVTDEEEAQINLLLLEEKWSELIQALPDELQTFRHAYLHVVAELSRNHSSLDPAELSRQLDLAESLLQNRRIQKAQLAIATIDLLAHVVAEMLDAPGLDRPGLIESARLRTERALAAYDKAEPDVGLYALIPKAIQLYHLLSDNKKQKQTQALYDEISEGPASHDEWDQALIAGHITQAHHLFLKARHLLDNPAGSQEKEAVSLLEAALVLAEQQELRLAIAERLIDLHLRRNEPSAAADVLGQIDEIPAHRLLLLKASIVQTRDGLEAHIDYLSDKADEYPNHLSSRRALVRLLISRISDLADDPDSREEISTLVEQIRARGQELQYILPVETHKVMVARGLFATRDYNGAVRLLDEVVDSAEPSVEAMQIRAEALMRLQRLNEAARQIADIAESTADPMYAVNAAAYWLEEGEAEKAITFLEPWLDAHPDEPRLKFNLAAALIQDRDNKPEEGRRAFNLLAEAYGSEQVAGPDLWFLMSRAASIAGKEGVARRYLRKALPTPAVVVQGKDDIQRVWESGGGELVGFHLQGRDGIDAFAKWQQEQTSTLHKLYSAELLSYGDFFRQNGRMFESWTFWTETARKNYKSNPEATAIKAPWPTSTRRLENKQGLLIDITALLTIWRLGNADKILSTLKEEEMAPHVRSDDLEMLRRTSTSYVDYMFDTADRPYQELVEILKEHHLLRGFDQEEIERLRQAVPELLHEHLMASTPDFGLACELEDAVFVSDRQDGLEYDAVSKESRIMTSANLLGALVGSGLLGEGEAQAAAEQDKRFRGWEEQKVQHLPDQVVMSGFALLEWFETGLLTAFEEAWLKGEAGWPELHLGPFGSHHLREQDVEKRTKTQKQKTTSTLYAELKQLIEQDVVTVLPVEDRPSNRDSDLRVTEMATYATKLIQIAGKHDLHVWSDDRVVGYLLWSFGHPLPVPELRQEFIRFRKRHSDVELTTTEELVETLRQSGILKNRDAEDVGYELFMLGYRPLNFQLALAHLFRNYAYQSRSPRYDPLFRAIKSTLVGSEQRNDSEGDIPEIDPEPLQRLMFASMLPDLIASVWHAPVSRSLQERRALATDLIDLFIDRLKELGQSLDDGMTFFWVGLLGRIVTSPVMQRSGMSGLQSKALKENEELLQDAVEWFTEVLTEREDADRRRRVVRGIEDYLIDFLTLHVEPKLSKIPDVDGIDDTGKLNEKEKRGWRIAGALHSMQPLITALFESELFAEVNPLFRRILGVLAKIEGGYKVYSTISINEGQVKLEEDEKERFALLLVSDAIDGDPRATRLVREDWSVEGVWHRSIPEEERDENPDLPETHDVPIKISLIRLLLRDEVHALPELVDVTIRELQLLDPSLGQDIQQLRDDLSSDDESDRRHGREALALSLLRSPFFELQRDLQHAIPRLRRIKTNLLEKFVAPEHGWLDGEIHPEIEVVNDRECPKSALVDFKMLFSEPEDLFKSAVAAVGSFREEVSGDGDNPTNLQTLVTTQVSVIRTVLSPFAMARGLLTLLIIAESTEEPISFFIAEQEWTLPNWIGSFVGNILDRNGENNNSGEATRENHYKIIHATVLRMGANIVGSSNHMEKWNEELDDQEEAIRKWILFTILLANRMTPPLIGRFGDVPELGKFLEEVTRNLNIAYDQPIRMPDRFNPFLLGPHLLDHEVAAVLYVLSIFVEYCQNPGKVLGPHEIQAFAEQWQKIDSGPADEIYSAQEENARDVLGLQMPLSPRVAALILRKATEQGIR